MEHLKQLSNSESKDTNASTLTVINNKPLFYTTSGPSTAPPVIFIHGLGGTSENWTPLIQALNLENSHSLHLVDLEGQGLSPTSSQSIISIESLATDVNSLFEYAQISSNAILIAHSMGTLVAMTFALAHPQKLQKLILLGPPESPLPKATSMSSHQRAELARTKGMSAVADAATISGTLSHIKKTNPLAFAAVRMSLLGQNPEGYAKACTAFAEATRAVDTCRISTETLIITGSKDKVSPPDLCAQYARSMCGSVQVKVLENIGHWHMMEDYQGVTRAITDFGIEGG